MRTRFLIASGLIAAMIALVAPSVSAETRRPPGEGGGAYIDPDGDPTAVARDSVGSSGDGGGSGSAGEDPCYWAVIVEDDFEFFIYDFDDPTKVVHSATGRWLEHRCPSRGAVEVGGSPLAPEGGLVDPYQLALEASSSVRVNSPVIRTSPSESGRLYVHIPTWLWLEPGWWRPYEATANAGRVIVTARATPVSVVWGLGDGDTVTCGGPGTAWRPGMDEAATDCSHTYRTSSASRPDGSFELSASVVVEVTWTSNAGEGGTLAPISRSSSTSVEVGEIQAVGTNR
jgi:hypothetical protein